MSIDLFIHGKTFLPELKATWRIILIVLIFQVAGGMIGIVNKPVSLLFINFWFGAALASLPGVLIGIVWEWHRDKENFKKHFLMILFYLVAALLLSIAAYFLPTVQHAF